jgi:hypothetical protein
MYAIETFIDYRNKTTDETISAVDSTLGKIRNMLAVSCYVNAVTIFEGSGYIDFIENHMRRKAK